jgi:hypothetical protein
VIQYRLLALGYALDALDRKVREVRTNWSPEIEKWLKMAGINVPAPWCAAFVFAMVHYAFKLAKLESPLKPIVHDALVQSYVDWARKNKKTVTPPNVHAGDIVCFDFKLDGHYDHIGLVLVAPDKNGDFRAVEGNTDDQGGREGVEVAIRKRNVKATAAIFINYDTGLMYEGTIPSEVRAALVKRGLLA